MSAWHKQNYWDMEWVVSSWVYTEGQDTWYIWSGLDLTGDLQGYPQCCFLWAGDLHILGKLRSFELCFLIC